MFAETARYRYPQATAPMSATAYAARTSRTRKPAPRAVIAACGRTGAGAGSGTGPTRPAARGGRRGACASRARPPSGSGTIAMRVATPSGQVDQLDVEHDRGDPLPGEEVLGGLAREALEAALGVLDVADDPDRRERVEQPAEHAPVAWLGGAHVRAVRLDAAAQGDVGVLERVDELRQLRRRRGHVGVGEDDEVALRGEHPRLDRGALAGVRDGHHAESSRVAVRGRAVSGRARTRSAVPSLLPSSTTRTSIRGCMPSGVGASR